MNKVVSYHHFNGFGNMIGRSAVMQAVYAKLIKVAAGHSTILITGESGTGKELVARAIHKKGPRRDHPLVIINCGALPENLMDSELFGHCKGAFTGAVNHRRGRLEEADGGTLFLDEVGDLPLPLQVKLLRVIQFNSFERIGENTPLHTDLRLIAATHRNLKQCISEGSFRPDLYYRLNVVPFTLPPLRERLGDIPLLVNHFLKRFAAQGLNGCTGLSAEAYRVLENYPFPGNVRELENIIERALILSEDDCIQVDDLSNTVRQWAVQSVSSRVQNHINKDKLWGALQSATVCNGNQTRVFWFRRLRCIDGKMLLGFLMDHGRKWFSRNCFARYMETHSTNKCSKYKTAGVYLNILKKNRICVHNGKKANQSAYRLHHRFRSKPSHTQDYSNPKKRRKQCRIIRYHVSR